jgi:phosphatidate phosphatase APP1
MGIFKKDKLQILGFQGYGKPNKLYVRGRALEDEEIDLQEKGFFKLIQNTWKRFETDEIKHTSITVILPNASSYTATTDKDGYFLVEEEVKQLDEMANTEGWVNLELSYTDTNLKREILHQNRFPTEMLIPSNTAKFGVISDIDDTILHTGVVSSLKWRVLVNTVFKRATKRAALEGTASFYHRLHLGKSGTAANPIFYVSHSPWNLYRYLELFLKTNDFPKGPILLRSMASFRARNRKSAAPQKQHEIVNILETYRELPFVLIGDSGEKDGDIYIEIAKRYPNQVKAIYLRSVNDTKRIERVTSLFKEFKEVPFLLVKETEDAVIHAQKHGFIKAD